MEPGKQITSDASSGEPEKNNEENTGLGRSYECTFCKRGFTNAQALGGHMNIHRKDKAKAKQKNQEEPSIKNAKQSEDYPSSRYVFGQNPPVDHYRPVETPATNYQVYMPTSNPSFQSENYGSNMPFWGLEKREDDKKDENLSLRMGLPHHAVQEERKKIEEKKEVDLELRLGHDP